MTKNTIQEIGVQFRLLDPEAFSDIDLPSYETSGSAGMDIRAAIGGTLHLRPRQRLLVPTNIAVAIPPGYEIQVRPRSGLAVKHGVTIVNAPGTIDSDYRGEIKIGLINLGAETYTIQRGDRIAQLILAPVARVRLVQVEELEQTSRGSGGFGHTGV
jgi:dUTP pyrophosphatase